MTPSSARYHSSKGFADIDRAGLTRDRGAPEFERPIIDLTWQVPSEVDVEDGCLVWTVHPEDVTSEVRSNPWRRTESPMLRQFLELADADDNTIAAYASNWGVLWICPHGLPGWHTAEAPRLAYVRRFFGAPEPRPAMDSHCANMAWIDERTEPIATWRHSSASARALLEATAALHMNRPPNEAARACLGIVEGVKADDATDLQLARLVVGGTVDVLLSGLAVRLEFLWTQGTPQLSFATRTFASALALDLALAASRSRGIATCSSCSQVYFPTRNPRAWGRHYCSTCRAKGIPLRDAQRDHRAGTSKPQ